MGKTQKPPSPPDPVVTANAQTASNRDTAITQAQLNQVDQVTPFGNLSFEQIGTFEDGTPRFRANTTLSPEQQTLLDQQQRIGTGFNDLALDQLGQAGQQLGTPVDLSDPAIGGAIADRFNPRLDRRFGNERERLEADLANRGIKIGSQAHSNAIRDFGEVKNDAFNRVNIDARAQAIAEILGQRNQSINELGFFTGAGSATQPQFASTVPTGVDGTDVAGIINNNFAQQLANFQTQQNSRNSRLGAIAGLGSTVAGWALSDRRAKENIKKVGKLDDNTPIYSYRYKGGGLTQLGVMAQDIEKTNPAAVAEHESGFKVVNYDAVTDHAIA